MPTRRQFLTAEPLRDAIAQEAADAAQGACLPLAGNTVRLGKVAMASDFEVILNPDCGELLSAASEALELIDRLEDQMSVFRPGSELSRLNARAADEPVVVEPQLYELLKQTAGSAKEFDGAFDPTAGPLVTLWKQCRREKRVPTAPELEEARSRLGAGEIDFDDTEHTIRYRRPGIELNLNAIGKGYALDRAAALLGRANLGRTSSNLPQKVEDSLRTSIDVRPPIPDPSPARGEGRDDVASRECQPPDPPEQDSALDEKPPLDPPSTILDPQSSPSPASWLLHGGHSSILSRGSQAGADGWPIALRHPLFPNRRLATIRLKDRGMSTSGSGVQFYRVGGRRFGHLLDPRTGWPAEGVLTVTVLAPTAALAEVLSTAFFVRGVEMAREYCHNHPEVAALIVPAPRSGPSLEPVTCGIPDSDLIWETEP